MKKLLTIAIMAIALTAMATRDDNTVKSPRPTVVLGSDTVTINDTVNTSPQL